MLHSFLQVVGMTTLRQVRKKMRAAALTGDNTSSRGPTAPSDTEDTPANGPVPRHAGV